MGASNAVGLLAAFGLNSNGKPTGDEPPLVIALLSSQCLSGFDATAAAPCTGIGRTPGVGFPCGGCLRKVPLDAAGVL